VHDETERVNILNWLLDLESDLLDLVVHSFHEVLGSLVEVLSVGILPGLDPLLKPNLDVVGLEGKSTNLVGVSHGENLLLESSELLELLLEVFKLWVGSVELLERIVNLVLPEPVDLLEALKELVDGVLGTLNGTGKEEDDLDDLLILGNPVVEWLTLVFWDVLLVPVLHVLGGLKDVRGSSVNCTLDFLKRWLESAAVVVKMDVDLEEWLEDLLWHVSASTNSLLHLVEGVLGGVEESLIHGPVVVLGQLLDFLGRDWLDMLVKLVGADGLDKIFNCTFNFVVLGLELLRFFSDPVLLHGDEVIESEGLGILRKVDQHSL